MHLLRLRPERREASSPLFYIGLQNQHSRHPARHRRTHAHTTPPSSSQCVAGLLPDGRQVVNRAAAEAANYKAFYGEAIPGRVLVERLAAYMHLFNLYWSMRCAEKGGALALERSCAVLGCGMC